MSAPASGVVRGSIDLDRSLREGWQAVMSNPAPAFLGYLVYFALSIFFGMASRIPYVGMMSTIAKLIIEPALGGGLLILFLNLLYRRQPAVENVFAGINKLWRFLGATLLLGGLLVGLILPGAVILILAAVIEMPSDEGTIVLVIAGAVALLAGIVAYVTYWLRWMFALWVIADGWEEGSIITAFKRSAQLTQGHRLKLLLVTFVIGLIGAAGVLACCVGTIFTAPIAGCATGAIYCDLKSFYFSAYAQRQASSTTPAPPNP
jgi:hypothetical protein